MPSAGAAVQHVKKAVVGQWLDSVGEENVLVPFALGWVIIFVGPDFIGFLGGVRQVHDAI